jgi:enoyl-CoA hydratase/carnithine racemase
MPVSKEILIPATLHKESLATLELAFQKSMAENPDILILHAENSTQAHIFCLGLDLTWATNADATTLSEGMLTFCRIMHRLENFEGISLCHVTGDATGGGVGIAAACDILLAVPTATFQLSEGLVGLIPGLILPALRTRLSDQVIKKWVFTAAVFDALSAKAAGLVDDVTTQRDSWVSQLRRCQPDTVRDLKTVLRGTGDAMATRTQAAELLISAIQQPHRRDRLKRLAKVTSVWS